MVTSLIETIMTTWQQVGVSPRRLWLIAQNTFLEALRARLAYLLAVYAVLVVLAVALLPQIAAGKTAGKVALDTFLAATSILTVIVAAFVGTRLLEKETDRRTILLILARPISRTEFILGKHLGLSLVLLALTAGFGLLNGLGIVLLSSGPILWRELSLALIYGWLESVLIAAVAIFFSSFMGSLLAVFLTLAVYLTGHLSRDLLTIGLQLKDNHWQSLTQTLYVILPDLERFNLKNLAVYGVVPEPSALIVDGFYGLLYVLVVLCVTVFVFDRREF